MIKKDLAEAWIGLSKKEGNFTWESGQQLSNESKAHWLAGSPDDSGGNRDCVIFTTQKQKIEDILCTNARPFVCQKLIPGER